MEIFWFDGPRSNWHKLVLGEFISHPHSGTSHNCILFRQSICQGTFAYLSVPRGRCSQGSVLLIDCSIFWHVSCCCGALIKSPLLTRQSFRSGFSLLAEIIRDKEGTQSGNSNSDFENTTSISHDCLSWEKAHLFRHLVFVPHRHHDGYPSVSLWNPTSSLYVNLDHDTLDLVCCHLNVWQTCFCLLLKFNFVVMFRSRCSRC